MKKILITGANGFVGSHLIEKALKMDFETYAAVRKSGDMKYLSNPKIKIRFIDFNNQESLEKLFSETQFDYIIHNAGSTIAATEEEYNKSNFENLKVLTDLILTENIQLDKFIYISSLAAFGPTEYNRGQAITNETIPHPVTAYGRSKLLAEEYLKKANIPFIIIRPTAVYGKRDKGFIPVYKSLQLGIELYATRKKQKLSFVYVDDLVNAIFASFNAPTNSSYFVSDGQEYSLNEFYRTVKNELGTKSISLRLPETVSRTIAYVNELVCRLFCRFPSFNKDKVNELAADAWICDIGNLKNDTGFVPKYTLKEGMSITIKALKDNKYWT